MPNSIPDLLDMPKIAALAGVAPATIRAYHCRGYMPPPVAVYGRSPVWTRAQINEWMRTRRGAGRRGRRADDDGAN